MKSHVAIVGRPNVGKSTLFNRLAKRRLAIVEDEPGVTRDRHYADTEWGDYRFTLIDTGGFVPGEKDALLEQVREQAQLAVEECEVILFVVDGRAGLTAADEGVARFLRKSGKPTLLVVNKLDSEAQEAKSLLPEFHRLGMAHVFGVSAEHGRGTLELVEKVVDLLPESAKQPEEPLPDDGAIRMAIVGRPNVGKSTLVNALLTKKRLVASPVPGTTRDPIDSELDFKGQRFILTDTAGIRRKSHISQKVEQFSVIGALRTVERSEVAVVLLDATEPAVEQDLRIAGLCEEKGRALILVVNKWDAVKKESHEEAEWREALKRELKFVSYAPVIFTSALHGRKVEKVLEIALELHQQYNFRAPTPRLNKLLEQLIDRHPAPVVGGRPLRLYYMAQVSAAPPTFVFNCNRPDLVPGSYKKFLTNQLREVFGLKVPIRLHFRERPGQAKRVARKKPNKHPTRRPKRTER